MDETKVKNLTTGGTEKGRIGRRSMMGKGVERKD